MYTVLFLVFVFCLAIVRTTGSINWMGLENSSSPVHGSKQDRQTNAGLGYHLPTVPVYCSGHN
jgi:hypothetical protein